MPFSALREAMGPRRIEIVNDPLPVSVIVRTKDRQDLLTEAVASIRATGYPVEIVVVNDGGARPHIDGVTAVEHETSRGRSEAANAGVRAAKNDYIVFLDDDDLFYPEHVATLANAARGSNAAGWYSDAVSAFIDGARRETMRIYARDFDRELLLIDNYIPLPTLLHRRADFLELGGFDPAFDLFEDWDFLIRLAQRGDFIRVPRITCEIRHIKGSGSVIGSNPEGSAAFRANTPRSWARTSSRTYSNVRNSGPSHSKASSWKLAALTAASTRRSPDWSATRAHSSRKSAR
jgi:glycosyltransferase involved in cell wall biosynthesis